MNPSRFSIRSWLTIGISLFLAADLLAQTRPTQTPTRAPTTPARPTGTGGTIIYTILSTPTATGLSLQQSTAYVKASSAIVKLALVN